MRLAGLAIALLASSLGARAESLEDRVAALEARVKTLESALQAQSGQAAASAAAPAIDGEYKATMQNGATITATFEKGKVTAISDGENKTGTYEIVGHRVIVTSEGKVESLTIESDRLRTDDSNHIEFLRTKK